MTQSLRSALKTSPRLEQQGVTFEQGNTRVTLRRAGGANVAFNAAMAKIQKDHGRALKLDIMPEDKATALMYEVFAEHVVVKWETLVDGTWVDGIEGGDGDVVPASFENVVAYFNDVPEWFNIVKANAEDIQYYREALISHLAGK